MPHSFSQHLSTSLQEKKVGAREGTPRGSQAPWLPETAGAAEPEQLALELQELPVCPGSTLTRLQAVLCCTHAPGTCCKRGHLQRTLHQGGMPFLWVTVCSQAPKRSPDTPSEQPVQRTHPSHECSAAATGRGPGQSWQADHCFSCPDRAQLCAGSTPWPLRERELWLSKCSHTCLLGITGTGGHGTPRPTPSQHINRGTSETGGLEPSTGAGNPAGSIKPSLMGHQPKAPEQTLPSPSEKHKCFKGDSAPLTDLLHPLLLPTNSPRLALSP